MPKPHNFNLQRELDERDELDWKFGALSQPALVSIPAAEREQYLPLGETQFDQFVDFTDCASRSPANHLEAVFTYHYQHEMKPENKKWLEDNGYVNDSKITFSDRFIAVGSGTTREGNSLRAPIDYIHKNGLIPKKLLPKEDWMHWEDYYDNSKITPFLKTLGQDFLKRFTISYEQVAEVHFAEVLKDDMLGVAAHSWPQPVEGVYPPSDGQFNHAFLLYNHPKWQCFDNYMEAPGDFTKNLSPEYEFYDYAYRVYVSAEKVPEKKSNDGDAMVSLLQQLLNALTAWWQSNQPPTPPIQPPKPPVTIPPVNPASTLYNKAYEAYKRGEDLSNSAPNELGCAESLSRIIKRVYPDFPIILSTTGLNLKLSTSYHFTSSANPIKGAVTIFPTVGNIIGHAGVWGKTHVMSNSSATGKWTANYTHAEWYATAKMRGLQIFHYIPTSQPLGRVGAEITTKSKSFMDSTVTSALIIVVGAVLSLMNVHFAGDLTQLITAVVTIGAAVMAWYNRTKLMEAPSGIGDVNAFGKAR